MKALEGLRAAGATVVFDDSILPDSFAETVSRVYTMPYVREGTEKFLAEYGPAQYHSSAEYEKATGSPLPATIMRGEEADAPKDRHRVAQAMVEIDPQAEANYMAPRRGRSQRTTMPSIGCISMALSIPRFRCRRLTRPCHKTGRSVQGRTAIPVG